MMYPESQTHCHRGWLTRMKGYASRVRYLASAFFLYSGITVTSSGANDDTVVYWNLSGVPNEPVPTVAPSILVEGLSSSGLLRGPGVVGFGLTNGFSAQGFTPGAENPSRSNAIENGKYLGWDVTVQPGYIASFSSVDLSLRRSALNGPMFYELQYSFDNFQTPGTKIVDFTYRGRASGTEQALSTNPEEYMKFGAPDSYLDPFDLPPDLAGQSTGASVPGNPMPTIDLSEIAELQDLPGGTTVTFGLFAWGNGSTTTSNTVGLGRVHGPRLQGSVAWDTSAGVPLEIRSEYPNTDPAPGTYTLSAGTVVSASASLIDESGTTRIVPVGWTGTGSVGDGVGDSASFVLNEPTVLEWDWSRENTLSVTANGAGSVLVRETTRFPLLGFDFSGYVYLGDGEYADGQFSNEDGVPASSVADALEPSTITRGPGVEPVNLSVGGISSSRWHGTSSLSAAISGGKYYQFNVTPKPGVSLEVNSILLPYRSSQNGPSFIALLYSFDGFTTYTVVESLFINDNNSGVQTGEHLFMLPDDPRLQDITGEVLFRVYGWDGFSAGGTFAIYNSQGLGAEDFFVYGGTVEDTYVTGTETFWVDEASVIALEAIPASGSLFAGWSGGAVSNVTNLRQLEMVQPRDYTASFEASSDGLIPDWWRDAYLSGHPSGAEDDPDGDGFSNYAEYLRGTDPTVAEELVSGDDVVISAWENTQRDPQLPGGMVIRDFGMGFRGVWEGTNHNRSALDPFVPDGSVVPSVNNTSFDGPRMILREEVWDDSWNNATLETVFSVGDDDGTALYFRYQDELNWYRVVIAGQNDPAANRPRLGVSVQKRRNGEYTSLGTMGSIATDPSDSNWYKRVRIRVEQYPHDPNTPDFVIRVIGWDEGLNPPQFSASSERTMNISESDSPLEWGRAGLGTWAQGGAPSGTVHPDWNPVNNGTLFESFRVMMNDSVVFEDDWATAPLAAELPAGWENAFEGVSGLAGTWRNSAHGTIAQVTDQGNDTSGTATSPAADADGPTLLAPETGVSNYVVDFGIHAFNLGAAGLVFDYIDQDNYGRVLFVNTLGAGDGGIPRGVVVSRKQNGAWSDIFIGDTSFVFTRARPFEASFSRSGSNYVMTVRDEDSDEIHRWQWTDHSGPAAPGRHGLTSWQAAHTHFQFLDIYGVQTTAVEGISIVAIEKEGETILLTVDNPSGAPYSVQRSTDLTTWSTVATEQIDLIWAGEIPAGEDRVFWRLVR